MKRPTSLLIFAVVAGLSVALPGRAAEDLAQQGYGLLQKYCYRCHGVKFQGSPDLDMSRRDKLVAARDKDQPTYLVPKKPDESYIWQRVGVDKEMPPSGAKPSDAEKALLKKWIEAGAPFPERQERAFKGEKDILTAVHAHLGKTDKADRRFLRYFTLTHLYNNKDVTAQELRLYRAGLAKLLNSLTWERDVVVPQAIDAEGTVYTVDLRDLGWENPNLWNEIIKTYPYGIKFDQDRDASLRNLAQEVYDLSGSDLPYLRADWFVAVASRPPLYHFLLELPTTAKKLEDQLRVNVEEDFLNNNLARAGFTKSGVSSHNRLIDRHRAVHGAYWKSYDFKSSDDTGNLFRYPLGPHFDKNPYSRQAFQHAGGEIIFTLPNGLQGYLLVDDKGNRIDDGPVEVVHDDQRTSGGPNIVNGLSCMACHRHGPIDFEDTVRKGMAIAGTAREKADLLFLSPDKMKRLVQKDRRRFLSALEEAAGPFLKVGNDASKDLTEFAEPVGAVALRYQRDMGARDVALELGIADPTKVVELIKYNRRLRDMGLGPIAEDKTIKREVWQSRKKTTSLFHDVAKELELGYPVLF